MVQRGCRDGMLHGRHTSAVLVSSYSPREETGAQELGVCGLTEGGAPVGVFFFFQAEDGIRDYKVTGLQTCALPIFQFDLAFDYFHDVFDLAAFFLLLKFFRFLPYEFVEAEARQIFRLFAGGLLGMQERLVQLVDLFRFTLRLRARNAKCPGLTRRGCGRVLFGFSFSAGRFDLLRGRAEVPLDFSFFFLRRSLPEDILIFCVGLREVVETESLREFELAAPFRIALHDHIDAPFDLRGRTLPASPEILVVFDLELTDVPFELAQLLVDGGHVWRNPSSLHARSTEEQSQPDACTTMRIAQHARSHHRPAKGRVIGIARRSALC